MTFGANGLMFAEVLKSAASGAGLGALGVEALEKAQGALATMVDALKAAASGAAVDTAAATAAEKAFEEGLAPLLGEVGLGLPDGVAARALKGLDLALKTAGAEDPDVADALGAAKDALRRDIGSDRADKYGGRGSDTPESLKSAKDLQEALSDILWRIEDFVWGKKWREEDGEPVPTLLEYGIDGAWLGSKVANLFTALLSMGDVEASVLPVAVPEWIATGLAEATGGSPETATVLAEANVVLAALALSRADKNKESMMKIKITSGQAMTGELKMDGEKVTDLAGVTEHAMECKAGDHVFSLGGNLECKVTVVEADKAENSVFEIKLSELVKAPAPAPVADAAVATADKAARQAFENKVMAGLLGITDVLKTAGEKIDGLSGRIDKADEANTATLSRLDALEAGTTAQVQADKAAGVEAKWWEVPGTVPIYDAKRAAAEDSPSPYAGVDRQDFGRSKLVQDTKKAFKGGTLPDLS